MSNLTTTQSQKYNMIYNTFQWCRRFVVAVEQLSCFMNFGSKGSPHMVPSMNSLIVIVLERDIC